MIASKLRRIMFQVRNIRMARATQNSGEDQLKEKMQKEKVKFSQEQFNQMSIPNKKLRRSLPKVFKDKQHRSQSQQEHQYDVNYQKFTKNKNKFKKIPLLNNNLDHQRIKVEDASLDDLSRIRLQPQYLPLAYLKKVQKIFSKYDNKQIRQIATLFSKLMTMRYREDKIDYDQYQELHFAKLQEKLPKQKQVQQIYLIGQNKAYQEREQKDSARIDKDPIEPEINYSQNVIISYLLNRVPRTFATAVRIFIQIKYKFPDIKPYSMIDFGSGLSSGSVAFLEVFSNAAEIYNVQPNAKMRKLSRYLTEDTKIQHYQSLGELSRVVKHADIVYMGYVLSELRPQMIQIYLQALYSKTKAGGLLVVVEYGSPYGSRLMNEVRKWMIRKQGKIVSPCPHQLKCPLSGGNQWCHFDQSAGMYSKSIFGKLGTDNSVKSQKFSYMVMRKKIEENEQGISIQENITKEWDRVVFPVMKRGGHVLLNLCTKAGRFERRVAAKSHGQQYKRAKKIRWGDLWRFPKRIPNRYRKERKTGKRLW